MDLLINERSHRFFLTNQPIYLMDREAGLKSAHPHSFGCGRATGGLRRRNV